MKKAITLCLLACTLATVSFAQKQKPKDGTYMFKYLDLEYMHFHGICKVVVKGDSVKVIAVEDCHRAPDELIEEGVLKMDKTNKHSKHSGDWFISNSTIPDDDILTSLDFKKKIYYTP
jgi:hypothetical protein